MVNGVAHFAGCDEVFHAVASPTARSGMTTSATAYTGASVAIVYDVAYFGTFDNQVIALDPRLARRCGATSIPIASSRSIFGGGGRRPRRARRTRPHGARARRETGKARDLHDPGAHRLVAGDFGARAFVGSSDGRLYAVDLGSGKVVWEHDDGGALTSSPALASGRIVIGSTVGQIALASRKTLRP